MVSRISAVNSRAPHFFLTRGCDGQLADDLIAIGDLLFQLCDLACPGLASRFASCQSSFASGEKFVAPTEERGLVRPSNFTIP